jgi:hydroxymethylpyrimidine/phosphomethylpyrimidine kinase
MNMSTAHCALTIAGSDSGGGAGIQADLKAFAAHRVHGLSAVTALTAQNTRSVSAVHVTPVPVLQAQIDACFDDFNITAVKLGMLANAQIAHAVADALQAHRPAAIVLDPVMFAITGARLLETSAVAVLRQRLIPMATLITPNIPEAESLLERSITTPACADRAVQDLLALGAGAVLLKGGHLDEGNDVVDRYSDGSNLVRFTHPRLPLQAHGTGCSLASAIAALLCRQQPLSTACESAIGYVARGLQWGYQPGKGAVRVLDHIGAAR